METDTTGTMLIVDTHLLLIGYNKLVKRYQKWLEEAQPAPKTLSQMKSPVVDKVSFIIFADFINVKRA